MFTSRVRFTTALSSLDFSIILQYRGLAEKYNEHSTLLYKDESDGVDRSWESEVMIDQYIAELSQLSEYLTVTKHTD
jgi:hypothetical protein